ncbi:MAG: hypothetical protein A2445_02035 [Candidatus Jacksonbacteria bacterium RIFOXYC2_FULL_44_29]|nr:MAG: hypothetical protein A2295_04090 [Candidatus Jacksonbacteria bacterium RIFOXYB2_FULL_44_15]OGY78415.1 MAG: hypothetical protein A2445_02035 [Candidatus Jacksonbacteria bacterium RIFOXYC2_FULL_44_29]OGY80492.1 MAG: hypothetical protein A2550_01330 [Candidatus Jacksonbacteria bacterium RIFOXYD2_FULL_43_21]HBH46295.1 hypothetical protein [Candidatus Jacksonbacteria bacterium]HCC49903.1 hypothetical protein [Candidatus Jacksonbacteria bacterium]
MAKIKEFSIFLERSGRVGIDTSIFIYKFEQHPQFEPLCSVVFSLLSKDQIELITSTVTVAEILVRPWRVKDSALLQAYENIFLTLPNFLLTVIDYRVAKTAAFLRAKYNIRLPDALQIAAALTNQAKIFVTNDIQLKVVKDLKIACLSDYI